MLLNAQRKTFNLCPQAADQLTHAYKYGSFEKVIEFLNFRERLKNSFHYSLVTIEHLITDLIHLPSHEITVQVRIRHRFSPWLYEAYYKSFALLSRSPHVVTLWCQNCMQMLLNV